MRRQTSTAAAGTPRSRRHDARASRASGERAGGARKRTTATATPRQKGGDATATVTPSSSSSSYSPTVASGYSSLHRTPASVPRGSSYTPSGVTSHLGTTSPATLMARSVAAGLRGSRARELHDYHGAIIRSRLLT